MIQRFTVIAGLIILLAVSLQAQNTLVDLRHDILDDGSTVTIVFAAPIEFRSTSVREGNSIYFQFPGSNLSPNWFEASYPFDYGGVDSVVLHRTNDNGLSVMVWLKGTRKYSVSLDSVDHRRLVVHVGTLISSLSVAHTTDTIQQAPLTDVPTASSSIPDWLLIVFGLLALVIYVILKKFVPVARNRTRASIPIATARTIDPPQFQQALDREVQSVEQPVSEPETMPLEPRSTSEITEPEIAAMAKEYGVGQGEVMLALNLQSKRKHSGLQRKLAKLREEEGSETSQEGTTKITAEERELASSIAKRKNKEDA